MMRVPVTQALPCQMAGSMMMRARQSMGLTMPPEPVPSTRSPTSASIGRPIPPMPPAREVEARNPQSNARSPTRPQQCPDGLPEARVGLFFWLCMSARIDTRRLLPPAIDKGVAFMPGEHFYAHCPATTGTLRLSCSHATEAQADRGLSILAALTEDDFRQRSADGTALYRGSRT